MLWLRGLVFTALVPAVVAFYLPSAIDPGAQPKGGFWNLGWILVAAGAMLYLACLIRFLAAGGTPAIFFARPLRFLIGEEPNRLVAAGPYRFSRNPMYVGVVAAIAGQAIVSASPRIAAYCAAAFAFFHLIVRLVEEPHLRATRGPSYDLYCRSVPRWLGRRSARSDRPA